MAVKPTIEPVAAAPRSDAPPHPKSRAGASKPRSPVGRLASWLRGDRHMVGAYPPPPAADAPSPEREH